MAWILLLLLLLVLLIIIIALILRNRRAKTHWATLESRFSNTSSNPAQLGGILVSMISNDDASKILGKGAVQYSDFDQCASINRKTCSAWSYFRRDVWSASFSAPGLGMGLGFIADPRKMWPLITTMSVVDGDTNLRSACSNESGEDTELTTNSQNDCLARAFRQSNPYVEDAGVYLKKFDSGAVSVPSKCAVDDARCKIMNSGGTINVWDMIYDWPCDNFNKCHKFNPMKSQAYSQTFEECPLCSKPYLCSMDGAPAGQLNPSVGDNQLTAHVGKNSELWTELFTTDGPNIGFTAVHQCKYRKEDWAGWVSALRSFYTYLLSKIDSTNFSKYPALMADASSPVYLENEVNTYIYPDPADDQYKKQQEIFLDSLIGVFYVDTTCEDQLAPLSKHISVSKTCDNFFGTQNPTTRREIEEGQRSLAQKNARAIATLLSAQKGQNVPLYKATLDSSAFPYYKNLSRALKGTLSLSEMFVEV